MRVRIRDKIDIAGRRVGGERCQIFTVDELRDGRADHQSVEDVA